MDRKQAAHIYAAGREAVIDALISYAEQVRKLEPNIVALSRNSSNSSRPPSADPPWMRKTNTRKKSHRNQGGQPGHKGTNRKLVPPGEMDEIHDIFPEHCQHCLNPFSQSLFIPSSQPIRHQVFDLPVIVPIKKEYRCHSLLCQCGNSTAAKVLRRVLGQTFNGAITSDDHSAYASYHKKGLRQLCWAHIIRKLKALKEDQSSPHAYCFARHVLEDIGAIFSRWHAFQKSPGSREKLWRDTLPFRERINDFCIIFSDSIDQRVKTRTKRLLDNWQHLFTFLRHDGVEPTNNIAERAIRPAVQWRKICFGSQSQIGEHFTERLLTVARTCQMHDINVFALLTSIVKASFSPNHYLPEAPLLLPFQ